jgi:hypothetical protein
VPLYFIGIVSVSQVTVWSLKFMIMPNSPRRSQFIAHNHIIYVWWLRTVINMKWPRRKRLYFEVELWEMSYEESVSYFKRLENLEKIRRTNGPYPSSLPVDNKKSVTSSVGKSSKNHKDLKFGVTIVTRTTTIRLISEQLTNLKIQKRLDLKPKLDPERNLWLSFSKKLMRLKGNWSLKRLQAVRRGRLNQSSILSTEIIVAT